MDQLHDHRGLTIPNPEEDIDEPSETDTQVDVHPDETTAWEKVDQPEGADLGHEELAPDEREDNVDTPEAAHQTIAQRIGTQALRAEGQQDSDTDTRQEPEEKHNSPDRAEKQAKDDDSDRALGEQPDASEREIPQTQEGVTEGPPPGGTPPSPPDEEDDWGEPIEPSVYIDTLFRRNENGQTGFSELLADVRDSGEETFVGIVEVETGGKLEFEVDTVPVPIEDSSHTCMYVSIIDCTDEYLAMRATADPDDRSASFGLYTQKGKTYSQEMPRGAASAFIEATLDHFRKSGIDVQHIDVGFREGDSVLFPRFEEALKDNGDRAAAVSKATNGVYERLGYPHVDPDVTIRHDPDTGQRTVTARFSKPTPQNES